MKALTLTQPWATLVAIGAKKIETRSWSTAYRGPLAIHAGAGLGPVGGKRGLTTLCSTEPFCSALAGASLPLGVIVAVCNLVAVYRIPASPMYLARGVADDHPLASYPVAVPPFPDNPERAFGDYTPGRYAWLLEDVRILDTPVPCKGALSLWDWDNNE